MDAHRMVKCGWRNAFMVMSLFGVMFCWHGLVAAEEPAPSVVSANEKEMETKIRTIISQKGDVNQRERNIPLLIWAINKNYVGCVKLLLENQADPEIPPLPGSKETPLFSCSPSLDLADPEIEKTMQTQKKSYEIMKLLISHKANVKHRDILGVTPLHKAAFAGRDDLCMLLIDAGADVNAQDRLGNTPLHEAANKGYFKVVNLLIGKGAKSMSNTIGKTPLAIAEMRENEDLHKKSRALNRNFYILCDYDQTIASLKKLQGNKTQK